MPAGVDPHLYRPTARDKWRINAADARVLQWVATGGPFRAAAGQAVPGGAGICGYREAAPRIAGAACGRWLKRPGCTTLTSGWIHNSGPSVSCGLPSALAESIQPTHGSIKRGLVLMCRPWQIWIGMLRNNWLALPEGRRVLVTTHDAFGYFGRRYGLQVESLQGLSTLDEIDLRTMNRLIQQLVRQKVPAVFVESSVSPKALQAVVAGCRAAGHELRIGGELYADCLGPPGSPAETFLGAFRWNVEYDC